MVIPPFAGVSSSPITTRFKFDCSRTFATRGKIYGFFAFPSNG